MKLAKIEITNFRCYESFALELRPDVNVIVGVNGAGKTTILDAIAAALYDVVAANGGGGKRQRRRQDAELRPSDIHIVPGSTSAAVGRKDFVQFRAFASDFYEVSGFPNKTPDGRTAFLEWTDYIQYRPPAGFSYDTTQSERLSPVYQYFAALWQELRKSDPAALIPLPVVTYYRASRRLTEMPKMGDVFELELSREGAFDRALNAGADFQAMCQWFYLRENAELREKMQVRNDPDYQFPDLKAAREALVRTLEGVKRVFFNENPPSLKVAFSASGTADQVMELSQLSDGYRNLLALVLDFARRLAQAHPDWPNPLEAPGILLIDEIELHLHPRWQQAVIPNLHAAFPNTQIIVATHSPEVLTTVRRENIRLLGSDHAVEQLPADLGTFGAESSRVLEEVFAAHARPPQVETVQQLDEYLALVESQQQDTPRGRELRASLESDLGRSDPDIQRADAQDQSTQGAGGQMRTITRNPNPPACLTQQPRWQDWHAFMGTPCHQVVGESLLSEQHHVCCYCEVEIAADDSHIEHMVPRSVRQGHDYDYTNLAASCDGGAVEHCGRFKDDRHQNPDYRYDPNLFCPPQDPDTTRLFQYLPSGSVTPALGVGPQEAQKAQYMIGYLGLQCARLTGRRRTHARQLIDTLGPAPDPALIEWAIGYYLSPDPQGKLRQFTSLSRKILNQ